jgi:hypothetical protein
MTITKKGRTRPGKVPLKVNGTNFQDQNLGPIAALHLSQEGAAI